MSRRRAPNEVDERRVAYGPNPATVGHVGSLDVAYGRALDGHSGLVRIGAPSVAGIGRYAGDLGPLQAFAGFTSVGASPTIRKGFNRALPATQRPPAVPNPALDAIGRAQGL